MSLRHIHQRLYEILEAGRADDAASRAFDTFIITLIALNVLAIALQTVGSLYAQYRTFFIWFELVSVIIFSIEYVLRVWSCTAGPQYHRPIVGRIKFMLTPMAVVDLLAVLPFWLPFVGIDLRFFRALRFFRIFRLAKLHRYSRAIRLIYRVFYSTREQLTVALFGIALLVLVAAFLIYIFENAAQPEVFSSVPVSMWWAIDAVTPANYVGMTPVTLGGKILAAVMALLSIGLFALPTAILGSAFTRILQERRKVKLRGSLGANRPGDDDGTEQA